MLAFMLLALMLKSTKCEKNNPEPNEPKELTLPPATQIGANTFGCKLNGHVYVPKGTIGGPGIGYKRYHQSEGKLRISTRNVHDFGAKTISNYKGGFKTLWIDLFVTSGVYTAGQYSGFQNTQLGIPFHFAVANDSIDPNVGYEYWVDSTKTNSINITRLDLQNFIVSGTFEFTVIHDDIYQVGHDTIKVTEGRFDLNNLYLEP